MSNELSISVKDVTVVYHTGVVGIRDASLELLPSTICALVGVNGSGKSTVFKTIMGFLKPTSGTVHIGPHSIRQAQKKNLIAYVPQAEEVDWTFPVSVLDVVMMGRYGYMGIMRSPSAEDLQRCNEALEKVQMSELRDRQIGELSGGQRKRVFLARALAQQAKILLLDEPFTGVDVKTEDTIVTLLKELKQQGCIILVSTHNLGSVPEFCDHVAIIRQTVIAAGKTSEVFNETNLSKAFEGKLRQFRFSESTIQKHDGHAITVVSDDERPLVFGKGGHLEFSSREGREELIREREKKND